jgi:Fe-S-cluster containining protein
MIKKDTPADDVLCHGKKCDRKNHCCKMGSGFLIKDDLDKIAEFLKISVDGLKDIHLDDVELFNTILHKPKLKKRRGKHFGPCTFFNGKGCSIHEVKPLGCKVGNCSEHGEKLHLWFMLNHFLNDEDPESIRQYATYLKSGGKTLDGGELKNIVKDEELLNKILNFEILR